MTQIHDDGGEDGLELALRKIREHFDFDKIERVMWALRWEWSPLGRVPYRRDLEETVERLVREVWKDPDRIFIATGGFIVRPVRGKDECTDIEFGVEVQFDIARMDTREAWPLD